MNELIRLPNIGDAKGQVTELLVKNGDYVKEGESILTLESDKASMEIPCPKTGLVKSLKVKLGDFIKENDDLLELEIKSSKDSSVVVKQQEFSKENMEDVCLPDIGTIAKGKVVDILVKAGDHVEIDDSLIIVESDKASMEIPSPHDGIIHSVTINLDSEVKTGDIIAKIEIKSHSDESKSNTDTITLYEPNFIAEKSSVLNSYTINEKKEERVLHAGPAVRKLVRELNLSLNLIPPSGPLDRVLKEDVYNYLDSRADQKKSQSSEDLQKDVKEDKNNEKTIFGEVEKVSLSQLMRITARKLCKINRDIPDVTQFDRADITELEEFRISQNKKSKNKNSPKVTLLPILIKACSYLLKEIPEFNSSISDDEQSVFYKKYINIGFAVDTPDGLVVPVIKDSLQKGILTLADEISTLATKAREKKILSSDMQGGCFTISSLGHISGTGFTPIVNTPEVAILGVSKASIEPIWDGKDFQPRLMLPLSLSYDHRVINGVAAAFFTKRLGVILKDIRTILL